MKFSFKVATLLVSENSSVQIAIYSQNGQLINLLSLGDKSAGKYLDRSEAAYWDGKNLKGENVPSGIYFYEIQSNRLSAVRKMLLLK